MQITSLVLTAVLALTLPLFTLAEHLGPSRRHNALAHRKRGDVELFKRTSGRATFYAVGLGACGKWNNPGDFIVALNTPQFGSGYPGPNCFKSITISYQGKSTQATIMDECPGCPYGGLDMSEGLFSYFADTSVGVFYMDWWYNDGSSDPAPTTHTTTTTHKPKPTTTSWVDPSPWTSWTSTKTKTESSSSSSWTSTSTSQWSSSTVEHTSTSSSSTTASSSSSTAYASITAAPSPKVTAAGNIARVNQVVLALAELVRK